MRGCRSLVNRLRLRAVGLSGYAGSNPVPRMFIINNQREQETMKRTGPSNVQLQKLIDELRKKATVENVPLWRRIAYELERPTRQRRIVNLSRINRYTKENEIILVPGKVLAQGALDHSVTVAAYNFSGNAKEKIMQSKGKALALWDFVQSNPKPKDIKILG